VPREGDAQSIADERVSLCHKSFMRLLTCDRCRLNDLRDQLASSERSRRQLQVELNELVADEGKRNVHELERAKFELEQRVNDLMQVRTLLMPLIQ
jgi:hypothetical protein